MTFRTFPPHELQAEPRAWARLGSGLAAVVAKADSHYVRQVWLKTYQGDLIVIGVAQRDLEYKFEVFSLWIASPQALIAHDASKGWNNPPPAPPEAFAAWPLQAPWRVQVLRRTEFIIEDVPVEGALGVGPYSVKDGAPPGQTPAEASASCEVAVGLLFTGANGGRLMIAADWFPETLIFTHDETEISPYVDGCEAIAAEDYEAVAWGA